MSSTACLEATDRGSRVALVLDLGSTSGTATRSSYNGLPPVVRRPLKRWAEDHQLF